MLAYFRVISPQTPRLRVLPIETLSLEGEGFNDLSSLLSEARAGERGSGTVKPCVRRYTSTRFSKGPEAIGARGIQRG